MHDLKSIKQTRNRKYLVTFIFLVFSLLVFVYCMQYNLNDFSNEFFLNHTHLQILSASDKLLIDTPNCKITKPNPFSEDILPFVKKINYIQCSKIPLLTYIERNNSFVTLHINQTVLKEHYKLQKIKCGYCEVTRVVIEQKPDHGINYTGCSEIENEAVINNKFIVYVSCLTENQELLYQNVHATVTLEQINKSKLEKEWSEDKHPYSVVLVGIDSVSRLNFFRTMPKVHKFLNEHNFVSLKGYTKIDDNTFPNLIAVLTGRTQAQLNFFCKLPQSKLDECDIIWDRFNQLGYVTAYAEDSTYISTFQFEKLGFQKAPTDFYFHPYFRAAEGLSSSKRYSSMIVCSGPENNGKRVMNAAKDFLVTVKDYPKFGFFWMSSFSHDDINLPSSMDEKVLDFFESIYSYLNDTIMIFFSDHGFRYGDIRHTHTGWLEERQPFIFTYFPQSFKEKHPEKFNNFILNTERLTNPFDMYMTLQDILHLANASYQVQSSEGCPKCRSLFEEVDENRSCKDAAIDQHWCLCSGYVHVDPKEKIVIEAANFIVSELNKLISNSEQGRKCATYYLGKVSFAGISPPHLDEKKRTVHYLMVDLEMKPPAQFEATVSVPLNSSTRFELMGDFSRTDEYQEKAKCIWGSLKKYCYCSQNAIIKFLSV